MNIDQREWDLQEREGTAAYREIAHALRQDAGGPPPDFAAMVAAAAVASAGPEQAAETGVERWLLRGLAIAFGASCIGAVAIYGNDWLTGVGAGFAAIVPVLGGTTAMNWALAACACLGMSWSLDRLRRTLQRAA